MKIQNRALQKTEISESCIFVRIGKIWFSNFKSFLENTIFFVFTKNFQNKFGNKYKNNLTKKILKLLEFVRQIQNYQIKLHNFLYFTKVSIFHVPWCYSLVLFHVPWHYSLALFHVPWRYSLALLPGSIPWCYSLALFPDA